MTLFTTPAEAALEQENRRLKVELAHYRAMDTTPRFLDYPTEEVTLASPLPPTLRLAASWRVRREEDKGVLAALGRSYSPEEGLQLGYYISDYELVSVRDATTILTEMHRKVIDQLAGEFRTRLLT